MTRRLRTWRSPVSLYSRHSAWASSAETRRRLPDDEVGFIAGTALLEGRDDQKDDGCIGRRPHNLHHRFGVGPFPDSPYAQASTSATAVHIASGTSCPKDSCASAEASAGSRCTGTPASRARSSIEAARCPLPAATICGAPSPVYLSAAITLRSGIQIERLTAWSYVDRRLEAGRLQGGAQTLGALVGDGVGTPGGRRDLREQPVPAQLQAQVEPPQRG